MSERQSTQSGNADPVLPGASDATRPLSNRPAVGATQAPTASAVDPNWNGGTGATDFLGLDSDPRSSDGSASDGEQALPLGATSESLAADSWLLSLQTQDDAPIAPASGARDRARAPAASAADIDALADELDAAEAAVKEPPARRRTRTLVAVALVAIVLSGAAAYLVKTRHATSDVNVATAPSPKPASGASKPRTATSKPATGEQPASTKEIPPPHATVTEASTDVAVDPTPAPETPAFDPEATTELPLPKGEADPELLAALANARVPSPDQPLDGATRGTETGLDPAIGLRRLPVFPDIERKRPASSDATSHTEQPWSVRRATEADFAGLWREPTIPTDAIGGDLRLRTLNVGGVRALLHNGEYFEGTLYAVGQNRIWIQMDLGRISFDAASVRELVTVAIRTVKRGTRDTSEFDGLPRVDVRVNGGTLSGRLIGRSDGRVTLLTDSGTRIAVESDDVRPVMTNNTRVIGVIEGAAAAWAGVPTKAQNASGPAPKPKPPPKTAPKSGAPTPKRKR